MKKRVFIIHGYGAKPSDNWFPWLKEKLEKKGFEVFVPQMPDTDEPTIQKWLPHFQKIVGECDENTYFVGHSLGTITILKYLESLPANQKAGGVVLVGGFSEAIGFEKLSSFTKKPLDYEKVKSSLNLRTRARGINSSGDGKLLKKRIVAIHSTDDKTVSYKFSEIIRDKLGAKLITLRGAGHINAKSGYFKLPEALESILKISLPNSGVWE